MSNNHAPAGASKSRGWRSWGVIGAIVLIIILLVRSCAAGPETASTSTTLSTKTAVSRGGAPAVLDSPAVAPAPAALPMNMCAAISMVHLRCPVKPFKHGAGYIAVGGDVPEGSYICFYPHIKDLQEAWALADGDEIQLHDDGKWPAHVTALELNPKKPTTLIYWAQKAPCDPKNPTSK